MSRGIYDDFKRYRLTLDARTGKAYRDWNIRQRELHAYRSRNSTIKQIHEAELEYERREKLQMYHWLKDNKEIFDL